ncbi:hypothetical protein MKX08_003456 [Trichoderma sp. CBMAI-0020]|nr:hypothetical protein MKX08_003456 [Trichoderma sp. CBMAI-0020]WOD46469.1 hypothetical protein [Trichoderma atroviride]
MIMFTLIKLADDYQTRRLRSNKPASLKERSSRLQIFARPKSDDDVNTTTNIDMPTTAVAQQNRESRRYQSSLAS